MTFPSVGDGFPVPRLTQYGFICDKNINLITEKFLTVFVDKYVIMPNHIHILLVVQNPDITADGTGNPSPTLISDKIHSLFWVHTVTKYAPLLL